jgi:hypothetical protein
MTELGVKHPKPLRFVPLPVLILIFFVSRNKISSQRNTKERMKIVLWELSLFWVDLDFGSVCCRIFDRGRFLRVCNQSLHLWSPFKRPLTQVVTNIKRELIKSSVGLMSLDTVSLACEFWTTKWRLLYGPLKNIIHTSSKESKKKMDTKIASIAIIRVQLDPL